MLSVWSCILTGLPDRRTGHPLRGSVRPSQATSRGESSTTLPCVLFVTTEQHHTRHIASKSPTAVDRPWRDRGKSENDPLIPPITGYGSTSLARSSSSQSVRPVLRPASNHHLPSLFGRVSADLIPFAADLRGVFRFYRFHENPDLARPVRTVLVTDHGAPALIRIDVRGLVQTAMQAFRDAGLPESRRLAERLAGVLWVAMRIISLLRYCAY